MDLHYKRLSLSDRVQMTPAKQRHVIYEYIEEFIKHEPLSRAEIASLSDLFDELAKIHNQQTLIENGRLVSALTVKNAELEEAKEKLDKALNANRKRY